MIRLTLPLPPSMHRYWRHVLINGRPRTLTTFDVSYGEEYLKGFDASGAFPPDGSEVSNLYGRLTVANRVDNCYRNVTGYYLECSTKLKISCPEAGKISFSGFTHVHSGDNLDTTGERLCDDGGEEWYW